MNNRLNPNYTFENFIVGNNNKFAYDGAFEVANNPGNLYNPFYIFGENGSGKTHLMQAIGNKISQNNPKLNVCYMRIDELLDEIIKSIKELDENNEKLLSKFNDIDVLMIDDIQFIAGKDRCQEVFRNLFNKFFYDRKQMIISSDKCPRDIPLLDDRLKTRFEYGVVADISCLNYETRLHILENKVKKDNIEIDNNILQRIAKEDSFNVVEILCVLNCIAINASIEHSIITNEIVECSMNKIIENRYKNAFIEYYNKNAFIETIQDEVAKYFKIDKNDLIGKNYSKDVVFARRIAIYLCKMLTTLSIPQIGILFGDRDSHIVWSICGKIKKEIEENNNTKLVIEKLRKIILSHYI